MRVVLVVCLIGSFASGCLSPQTRAAMNETERMLPVPRPTQRRDTSVASAFEGPVRRERIVDGVLANDPELTSLAHRARALLHAARAEAAMPSPEIEAQVWSLPIARPYALGEASMYMAGVRQMIPALGGLDARARASIEEARVILAQAATRERELTRMAVDAYADLVAAVLHHRVHHGQLDLLTRMLDVSHARYSAGGSALADVSRIELERAREARALTRFDADAVRARATLNTLLHRSPDAAIATPEDLEATTVSLAYDDLVARVDRTRGEVRASEARVRAAQARVRAQEADANWPAFTIGVSYMQDPMRDPGLGLSAAMTMPWLTGAGRARVAQAREEVLAEQAMTEGARWTARREIAAAQAQLASAERVLRIVRTESMPAATRSLDAVRGSYVTGDADLLQWLDASRTALEFAMDEADAIADLTRAAGVLDSAVGEPLPRTPVATDRNPSRAP